MGLALGDVEPCRPPRRRRSAAPAAVVSQSGLNFGGSADRRGAAAGVVMPVSRPVVVGSVGFERLRSLPKAGPFSSSSGPSLRGRRPPAAQGVVAAELGRDVARARVRRRVDQAVAGQRAVLARPADPVVGRRRGRGRPGRGTPRPARPWITYFDRGLVAMAAVMAEAERVVFLVGLARGHDLARMQVVDLRDPRLLSPGQDAACTPCRR